MDEKELRGLTRNYWNEIDHKQPKTHLKNYITELLPAEMDWAETHPLEDGKTRLHKPDPPDNLLLVMLVGFSIEPLLQTVYAYNPSRVLLLLNEQYGSLEDGGGVDGINWGRMVKELIKEVKRDVKIEFKVIKEPEPKSIFDTFREQIGEEAENVVIDITGGKKNMMAGAFLYAAYANIKVSYVDFDDEAYDPEERRPYGYRCRIGLLNNPYQTFALRNWEQVRTLYNRYNFRAARELLVGPNGNGRAGTILEAARAYLPEQVEPIKQVVEILKCYELWDTGNFREAKNQVSKITRLGLTLTFPDAVTKLGEDWFILKGAKFSYKPERFYDPDTDEFKVYVHDEMERIQRLYDNQEDYRSAFLRAAGLNEVLMVARWVKQYKDLATKKHVLDLFNKETPNIRKLFRELSRKKGETAQVNWEDYYTKQEELLSIKIHFEMSEWWKRTSFFKGDKDWHEFINIRNGLAHTYLSVSEDLAKDAIKFVKLNFEDFLGQLPPIKGRVQWSELCQTCGLTKLLPPSLRSDE